MNTARSQIEGKGFDGADDFIAAIDTAPQASKALLSQLSHWAMALEQAKLVKLTTYHERNGALTLLPRLVADNAGLVSIYNNIGSAYLQFWRSVLETVCKDFMMGLSPGDAEASGPETRRSNFRYFLARTRNP